MGAGDFDFLVGRWTIVHHRLEDRLVGSDDWEEMHTDYEAFSMLSGQLSLDRLWGEIGGSAFEGVSLRTLDPETGEWTIYWMDSNNPQLDEQVRGRFENGVGTFCGEEEYRGTTYPMRFVWTHSPPNSARWEQAYQHPETGDWETNWIMVFTRASD